MINYGTSRDDEPKQSHRVTSDTYNGYHETVFDVNQIDVIKDGECAGLDVSLYAYPENSAAEMYEIRKALQKGLDKVDVQRYINRGFDSRQLGVIFDALDSGLTFERIDQFADLRHDAAQMAEVAEGLKEGLDVRVYDRPEVMDAEVMRALRHGLENGNDLSDCWSPGVSGVALEQIQKGYSDGTGGGLISYMMARGMSDTDLVALADGLQRLRQDGFDVSEGSMVFVQDNGQRELFAGEQLVELALGAHDGIDYGRYMDSRLDGNMMRQYRFALTYEGASKEVKDWFGRVVDDLRDKPEVKERTAVTVQEEDERTDAEWDALADQYDEIPF